MVKKQKSKKPFEKKPKEGLPKGYDPKKVEEGVKVLLQHLENISKTKKDLFEDDGQFLRIQITSVRIPICRYRHYRFVLPHGYLKDTSEVCLFVRNLSGNKDREYEETVRHFKNLISEAGVTSISEVISINQLKQEYNAYEMRRRIASRFDYIIADAVVSDWLHGCLGKTFHRRKKLPTPIRIYSKNLKAVVDRALHKTIMTVSGKGCNFMAKIGNTKQTVEQICENIEAFVKGLQEQFPGKWGNIRSLYIMGGENSIAIPIYFSFVSPNTIKVPKVKPGIRGKKRPIDEDEISTLPDGYKVMVLPDGTVKVKGKKANGKMGWLTNKELSHLQSEFPMSNEEDGSENDEEKFISGSEEEQEVVVKEEPAATDSEEEEAEVEAAEEAYLRELSMGMTIKGKKRKVKEQHVTPLKKSKKTSKGKSSPLSTQWHVEEVKDEDVKESKDTVKESKKVGKGK